MKWLPLLLLIGLASPVSAQQAIDCSKPPTPQEQLICGDENPGLGFRDVLLQRLYDDLAQKGGHDAALAAQADWLKKRKDCGMNAACILQSYDERIAELAREGGDTAGLTGYYQFAKPGTQGKGDMYLVRDATGQLSGTIETSTGAIDARCTLYFELANPIGDAWIWDDPDSENEDDFCRVLLRPANQSVRIDSDSCQTYCAVGGRLDETYSRKP